MSGALIIDLFAGGGGASMGIEMALGRAPDIAINHDPIAVAMHAVNHPDTLHFCQDIWAVKPETVMPGQPVGLLWASPDCKHFSKAKGGKPKERAIRDLAWVVVDWIEKRRPDVACIENVEEFRTWGPLDNEGSPIPEFAGQTFEDWIKRIRKAGYNVEWRESRACDHGAPTIRKRLCIIARRKDIGKVVWPAPTHGAPDSDGVNKRRLKPWRTAAEIIDWSLPCPSIFDDAPTIMAKHGLRAVRPLAANTGARVARGIKRYVLDAQRPFVVNLTHGARLESADEPLRTVTGANRGEKAAVVPSIQRFNTGATGHAMTEPLATANSFIARPGGAAPLGLLAPVLAAYYGEGKGGLDRSAHLDDPLKTVVTENRHCLVSPVLTYAQQGGAVRDIADPVHTICASRKDQNAVIAPHLMTMRNSGKPFQGADEPTHTVTAGGAHLMTVAGYLAQHNGGPNNDALSGRAATEPMSTVTTTGSQQGLIAASLIRHFGTSTGAAVESPAPTVMPEGQGKTGIVAGALVKYYGTDQDPRLIEPLHTVTTKDRFGLIEAALVAPPFGPQHESRAREVADFLRSHGAWDERELVTLDIDGATFVLADIGMRMLTPRELFNAQGFPPDYAIDRDATGRVFSKSDQIGRAGNSVSPPWAAAHVRANAGHLAQQQQVAA